MAPGFTFPPPPPPPPRQSQPEFEAGAHCSSQRGHPHAQRGRGRGFERGRGGFQSRGGYQEQDRSGGPSPNGLPGGTFVNPAFQSSYQDRNDHGRRLDSRSGSSDATRGQKRKRPTPGDIYGHGTNKNATQATSSIPPPTPSFGAPFGTSQNPLTGLPSSRPQMTSSMQQPKPKPQPHSQFGAKLGLVPRGETVVDSESEEEEDDIDEEAAFQKSANGALVFEYNGEVSRLETPADYKAWIAERKKRWPSSRRVAEKENEVQSRMDERRRIEAETRAFITSRRIAERPDTSSRPTSNFRDAQQRAVSPNRKKPNALNDAVMARDQDEASSDVDHISQTMGHHDSGLNDDSVAISDPVEAERSRKLDEQDEESDDAPEMESSAAASSNLRPDEQYLPRICNVYASEGSCKFGARCRYDHPDPSLVALSGGSGFMKSSKNGKRKSLYEQMIGQEEDSENALAVQAIKYLGQLGFLRPAGAAED